MCFDSELATDPLKAETINYVLEHKDIPNLSSTKQNIPFIIPAQVIGMLVWSKDFITGFSIHLVQNLIMAMDISASINAEKQGLLQYSNSPYFMLIHL